MEYQACDADGMGILDTSLHLFDDALTLCFVCYGNVATTSVGQVSRPDRHAGGIAVGFQLPHGGFVRSYA